VSPLIRIATDETMKLTGLNVQGFLPLLRRRLEQLVEAFSEFISSWHVVLVSLPAWKRVYLQ